MLRSDFLKLLGLSALGKSLRLKSDSTNDLIKPKRLPKNPTVGLIAPASPIYSEADYELMLNNLAALGFNIKEGEYTSTRNYGYLAGKDEQRVSDLHNAFQNPELDAILCIRGGYGTTRILDLIDYNVIKENPKPLIGFSDITALHLAIYKKTGLVTFHGPVGKSDWNDYTLSHFEDVLQNANSGVIGIPDSKKEHAFTINSGKTEGQLVGGNLTVLCSLLGSNYAPDWNKKVLFVEDVGEDVYRIDRMLSQLKLNGALDSISGFIFGECTACDVPNNSFTLKEVLHHYIKPLEIPAFYGAMISHDLYNCTIPIGINAQINADDFSIKLLESAVL